MVRFGLFVVPDAQDPAATVARVVEAERIGLDLVGIQDHPYQRRFLDTWTLLSYLAARTERIRLVPDVANLPLRPPAVLAKSAASLDLLSGGRLDLGLGAGAFWEAIAAMGGPARTPRESVDALEEALHVLRLMWSGERSASFDGEHYSLRGVHPGPRPEHRIEVWLGAYGPRMMRLTGRLADGWLPSLPRLPLEEIAPRIALLEEAADAAGRDPREIRRVANVNGRLHDGAPGGFLDGPPERWTEDLVVLHERHGFDTFILWLDGDEDGAQARRFAEEVAPRVREATTSARTR
jgi:alkanesulfonate monooxygenase SsuD/methylene tetrahydromethanopterin reductase-like flavin-dependent oxidoreductase (luciferase family)